MLYKSQQNDKHTTIIGKNINNHQYRLEITKIKTGMPPNHYLAYCIISKQSQTGLFVHQRLLTLNTARKQLSYYINIPRLPLSDISQLGIPKQTINYSLVQKFDFVLERIRIGHVNIQWIENNEPKSWKIIMGSNKLAQQFYELLARSLSSSKSGTTNQEINSMANQTHSKPKNTTKNTTNQVFKQKSNQKQQALQYNHQNQQKNKSNYHSNNTLQPIPQKMYNSKDNKSDIQPFHNKKNQNISISKQLKQHPTIYQSQQRSIYKHSPLQIGKPQNDKKYTQKNQNLVNQWLNTTNGHQKAIIYHKFVTKCQNKIELITQNFLTSHLQYQQEGDMCVLYDGQIKYYYHPLVDSTEHEGNHSELVQKIRIQEQNYYQFQNLNYLASFNKIADIKITVPMACMVTFKSFIFFCKTSLDYIAQKTLITGSQHYDDIISSLEKQTHLKISTNKHQLYQLKLKGNITSLYFDNLKILPYIKKHIPLSLTYIDQYITQGIISNEQDIEAIHTHINHNIKQDIINTIIDKQITSSNQIINILEQHGLTHHYLIQILQQTKNRKSQFLERVIISELIAKTMEWQIRRKMQLQLFKRRQFPFALNQIKISINMLLQNEKYYIKLINKIIQSYYGKSYDLENYNIQSNIIGQMLILSLLQKLAFHSQVNLNQTSYYNWIWKQQNIENHITLLPYTQIEHYRTNTFLHSPTIHPQTFIKGINHQINSQTSLETVMKLLKLQKDHHGFYLTSPQYLLLNKKTKQQVNYFLSHFLSPTHSITPTNVLQSTIYYHNQNHHYSNSPLNYLISLNKIRWLIKQKHQNQAEQIILSQINKTIIWNQPIILIQIYNFYSKFKFRQGQIKHALDLSLKSLNTAIIRHNQQRTIPTQLIIAQTAFELANIHMNIQQFSKAIQLYTQAEKILKKINTEGQSITLNPQFIRLYSRKCQIYLIFGQYQECLDQCLEGLQCCSKFKHSSVRILVDQNQFKIYEILFRCYQTKNMRKQMMQISNICGQKYFQDKVKLNQPINYDLLGQLIKLIWISIIKQVQIISPISQPLNKSSEQIKYIYLKKIRKEILLLKHKLKGQYRYNKKQIAQYLKKRMIKHFPPSHQHFLKKHITEALATITMNSDGFTNDKLFSEEGLDSPWLMLQSITCLTSYQLLIGTIENSLHLYHFQY